MSLTIQASSTNLVSSASAPVAGGSSTGATTAPAAGSEAERAYQAAVKDLKDAQTQLRKDTAAKASEDTLRLDQMAVQLAQAAVAAAAAAVAKENAEAQQRRADERGAGGSPDHAVDVYA